MGKKNRRKKQIRKWMKVKKPDEVLNYGPVVIARYGQFIHFSNIASPDEHAAYLRKIETAHNELIPELEKEVYAL